MEQTRHLATELPGPRSRELMARKQQTVSQGVATTMPVFATKAEGGIVEDVDGNRLIDLGSGIAVTTVGSSAPRVKKAVAEQLENFTHTCFMVTPYEGYVELAEHLAAKTPGDHEKRSALFNSGSEAVENAVKIARTYTGRNQVVVFDHAYHGRTNLTMAMTAKNLPYKQGFGPFAAEVYRAPMSYPYRDNLTGEEAARKAIELIETQVGKPAAVVIEPIQGEGGFVVPADGFLESLSEWCRNNGVVFVADEVQSGFGRTGQWFASEHEGIVPDLVVSAKGIAGGLPLSAVTGRQEIMDSVHPGGLGGTYGGNPLACAAALAVIETIEQDGLLQRAKQIEAIIKSRLTHEKIKDVRGRGAMIAAEFENAVTAKNTAQYAHEHGVIALTCGTFGNVIRFLPPLSISDELLNEGLDIVLAGMDVA